MAKENGRRNSGRERFWRQAIRRQNRSGLSIRAYCEENGLKEPSFYWWRRELAWRDGQATEADQRRDRPPQRAARQTGTGRAAEKAKARRERAARDDRLADADGTPRFVPIRLAADSAAAGGVEIVTRDGSRIRLARGFDRQTLVDVLSVLEGESC